MKPVYHSACSLLLRRYALGVCASTVFLSACVAPWRNRWAVEQELILDSSPLLELNGRSSYRSDLELVSSTSFTASVVEIYECSESLRQDVQQQTVRYSGPSNDRLNAGTALLYNLAVPAAGGIYLATGPENPQPFALATGAFLGLITLPRLITDLAPVTSRVENGARTTRIVDGRPSVPCRESQAPNRPFSIQTRLGDLTCTMPWGVSNEEGLVQLGSSELAWLVTVADSSTLVVEGVDTHLTIFNVADGATSAIIPELFDTPTDQLLTFLDTQPCSVRWIMAAQLYESAEYYVARGSTDPSVLQDYINRFPGTTYARDIEDRLVTLLEAGLRVTALPVTPTSSGAILSATVSNTSSEPVVAEVHLRFDTRSRYEREETLSRLAFEGGSYVVRRSVSLEPGASETVSASVSTTVRGEFQGVVFDILGVGRAEQRVLEVSSFRPFARIQEARSPTVDLASRMLADLRELQNSRRATSLGALAANSYFSRFHELADEENAVRILRVYLQTCRASSTEQTRALREARAGLADYLPTCQDIVSRQALLDVVTTYMPASNFESMVASGCPSRDFAQDLCDATPTSTSSEEVDDELLDWRFRQSRELMREWQCTMAE
jgi:hypothetical protein